MWDSEGLCDSGYDESDDESSGAKREAKRRKKLSKKNPKKKKRRKKPSVNVFTAETSAGHSHSASDIVISE